MKKIGITGGIGSGKSTVCRMFQILGVPVYDADSRAKKLMNSNPQLIESIKKEFGNESYDSDSNLNRSYLSRTVFNDQKKLEKLNSLVHPEVQEDFADWSKGFPDAKYVLKEAALLVETGSYKQLDKLIVISSPKNLRISRTLVRDPHRDEQQIESIIKKQLSDKEKLKFADFTLINDESHLLIPQILQLHSVIIRE